MTKFFKSLILSLFLITNANSGDIGEGELKMEDFLVDYFHQYITIKGGKSPETFVVATDGSYAMYWYCPTGSCRAGGDNVKIRQCEIKAGTSCKTFARGRTVKWKNGINPGKGKASRISSKWSKEELVAKLTELGFVGNTTNTTTTTDIIKKKETEVTKSENEDSPDVVKQLEQLKALLDSGAINQEEYDKAKKKILN